MTAPIRAAGLAVLLLAAPAAAQDGDAPVAPGAVRIQLVPELPPAGGRDLTVGDPFWVTVVTQGPRGWHLLPGSIEAGYADVPEVAVLGSDRRDGRLRLRLAVFRPGDVVLPPGEARVVTGLGDTLAVPVGADTIRVESVLAPGDTLLADIKPLWAEPWTPPWLWIAVAALVALAAALLWLRRRRAPEAGTLTAAWTDPYEEARARIQALAREGERGAGPRVRAAAGIGEAARGYLADAWGLPARERTTFELLSDLPGASPLPRGPVGAVLASADLAKFARVDPGPGAVVELADRALDALDRMEIVRRGARPPMVGREAS
ncbi:MAG TPA: hypothetical protein VM778_06430 [Gemmatimonadota bacterium]|nr:hypothetical protein [Gemmatimonadota bacterium]